MATLLVLLLAPACADPLTPEPPEGASLTSAPFADVTEAVGLEFVHDNGMTGELYMAENVGAGAAWLDYDGDGDLDAYLVQGGPLDGEGPGDGLLRNDPDPGGGIRFVDVTAGAGLAAAGYGMGVATGDYDNDGDVDLYVTNFGPNRLYRNEGNGTFADVTEATGTGDARWSVPATFVDYDGDGWLDLFWGNYVDFRLSNHRECVADGGYRDYCSPKVYAAVPDRLMRNLGDGTFADVTTKAGLDAAYGKALGVAVGDFDRDGALDLYVANDGMRNQLWMNNGDGTFREAALYAGCALNADGAAEASMGVDAGDLDNDGDEDLVMSHLTAETNTVYLNDGAGRFEDGSQRTRLGPPSWTFTGFGAGWLDYDNDGLLDFAVFNGAVAFIKDRYATGDPYPLDQPDQLFRNVGGGRFEDVTTLAGPAFGASRIGRGAAFGDVDNDGDTDILVTNNNGPARLLDNRIGNSRHWIGMRVLDGRRDALGALVSVTSSKEVLWRRVRASGSYASAHDPRLLVGLGDGGDAVEVRVDWVGGGSERFGGLAVDRYHALRRGEGQPLDSR